jgi:hypothetical protein
MNFHCAASLSLGTGLALASLAFRAGGPGPFARACQR